MEAGSPSPQPTHLLRGLDIGTSVGHVAGRIRAAEYDFVARYYSHNPAKNLSPDEAEALAAAGLQIVSVWEARGNDLASFSASQGLVDAANAKSQARACRQPKASSIYFAVDFDCAPESVDLVESYFTAVKATLGSDYVPGVYGSGLVCVHVLDRQLATKCWLAGALGWRGSRDFAAGSRWDIRQHARTVEVAGHVFDFDEGRDSYGGWQPETPAGASV